MANPPQGGRAGKGAVIPKQAPQERDESTVAMSAEDMERATAALRAPAAPPAADNGDATMAVHDEELAKGLEELRAMSKVAPKAPPPVKAAPRPAAPAPQPAVEADPEASEDDMPLPAPPPPPTAKPAAPQPRVSSRPAVAPPRPASMDTGSSAIRMLPVDMMPTAKPHKIHAPKAENATAQAAPEGDALDGIAAPDTSPEAPPAAAPPAPTAAAAAKAAQWRQPRTAMAQQLFTFAEQFQEEMEAVRVGGDVPRTPRLLPPEIQSTGGRTAREPVALVPVDAGAGAQVVVGFVDVKTMTAELRTYRNVESQQRQRGAKTSLVANDYGNFLRSAQMHFVNSGMACKLLDDVVEEDKGAAQKLQKTAILAGAAVLVAMVLLVLLLK